jgi:hypothetical protein
MQFDFDVIDNVPDGKGNFQGIHWLDEQGLANFQEFQKWRDENCSLGNT